MCSCALVCNNHDLVDRCESRRIDNGITNDIDHSAVRRLIRIWVLGIIFPSAAITWIVTRQFTISLLAAFAVPFLAIAQGSLGILIYRLYYGDAPTPISPSHGVAQVGSPISSKTDHHKPRLESIKHSVTPLLPKTSMDENFTRENSSSSLAQKPLRLLVIGDSLAIGVGQSSTCTPVFPEVVARTLSRRLNGRVVYWTCHGAPGASTGWIVRELEQAGKNHRARISSTEMENRSREISNKNLGIRGGSRYSSVDISDTDESTSDETSSVGSDDGGLLPCKDGYGVNDDETCVWRKRLARHRKRFEQSELLGPYDVVVVVTGSNDLKSAFFPFLLQGEDAELRRQAAQRGGNYLIELKRLSETLYSRMRSIRTRASSATVNVLKNVEETMEHIIHLSSTLKDEKPNIVANDDHTSVDVPVEVTQNLSDKVASPLPLLVFPGLPARALPIFRRAPLRWLAIPIVDILDMHKQKYAKSNKDNVLFVPAASVNDMECYENKVGLLWRQKCEENPTVCLRDVHRRDAKRLNNELKTYYSAKRLDCKGIILSFLYQMFAVSRTGPASSMFSVDSVHPNESGYDFMGRYVGNAIGDWIQRQES